ncbi:LamG domain-containing protein [Candidatus Poribacteria bacterium]
MLVRTLIVSLILTLITSVSCSLAVPNLRCVTDGLVSFWTFDESDIEGDTAKDVWSGKGATLKDDARIKSGGKIDEGLQLGEVGFAEVANDPVFDFGTGDYTIEAWVKIAIVERNPIVFMGSWGGPAYAYELTLRKGDPYKGCFARMYAAQPMYQVLSPGADKTGYLSDSSWHHIVFVRSSTSYMYIDGEVVGSTNALVDLDASSDQNLFIGKDPDPNYFNGMIDELRIYSKALSENEVQHNFMLESNELSVNPVDRMITIWGEIKALH